MRVFLSGLDDGSARIAMKVFLSAVEAAGNQKRAVRSIAGDDVKVFLSAPECGGQKEAIKAHSGELGIGGAEPPLLWNLMSYYYLRADVPYAEMIRDNSRLVMIDSGAHSFQKGKKVKWEEYTRQYAAFIREFDRPNVVGYFEMDVDNLLGYPKVLELREILEEESGHPEKIIPVWHKNRGIQDFKDMCASHAGQVVAITGFKNEDIRDEQYPMFVKEAWRHGCKIHCLGMTRKDILDKVPFDYVDSSSWAQHALFGRVGRNKVSKAYSKTDRDQVFIASYREAMQMQERYWRKWRRVCKDEF